MNGPGDIPLTHSTTPDTKSCSLISIIPTLGMSSCRGRAEAFARRLSSKLRTLGSQADNDVQSQEDEPIINGAPTDTWIASHDPDHTVTDLQPLRHESDSFFDFDCELESPGSPVDECEYLRLIESTSNTPHNSATESGYVCASVSSSQSLSDGPFYDINAENDKAAQQPELEATAEVSESSETLCNGHYSAESIRQTLKVETSSDGPLTDALEFPQTLPSEGPDLGDTASLTEVREEQSPSTTDTISVQDQILSALQKQSQEYDNETSSREAGEVKVDVDSSPQTHARTNKLALRKTYYPRAGNAIVVELDLTEQPSEELQTVSALESKTAKESTSDDTDKNLAIFTSNTSNQTQIPSIGITDDDDDCRPQRVRRCSSLKTGKTPPGTPGRKKIVRFADVLGLDLADVKTFLDEIPTIPKSAFEDLEIVDSEPPIQLGPRVDKLLMPLFQQPGGLTSFLDRVREKQVSLENAAVTDPINQTITGSVRVRNLDFHKSVHIRYTLDGWRSFADLQANYVDNSCDGFSDKFSFILFGNSLQIGQRLEFAVRFQCKGQQYWDNNYGTNYCFQCLPTSTPATNPLPRIVPSHHITHLVGPLSPSVGDAWCTSFY